MEIPSPKQFNLIPDEWTDYVKEFNMFFMSSAITDPGRKQAMLLYCGGSQLRKVFESLNVELLDENGQLLTRTVGDQQVPIDPYETTIQALNLHFNPNRHTTFERSKFWELQQEPSESTSQFVTRLRTATKSCRFDEYSANAAVIDQYIRKCSSIQTRKMLLKEQNLTIATLMRIAHAEESSTAQAAQLEKEANNQVDQYNTKDADADTGLAYAITKSREKKKIGSNMMCYGCGKRDHIHGDIACPAKGKECRFCHIVGHFELVCKKKNGQRQSSSNGRRTNRSAYYMGDVDDAINNMTQSTSTNSNRSLTREHYDECEENVFQIGHASKHQRALVLVDGKETNFIVDSGSTVNIMDHQTFKSFNGKLTLHPTKTKIFPYGSPSPLEVIGECYPSLVCGLKKTIVPVVVTQLESSGCILSSRTSSDLGLIQMNHNVNFIRDGIPPDVSQSLEKYPNITEGVGKLANYQLELELDEAVPPVYQKPRTIPFHLRSLVEKEIEQLIKSDIIEPVHHSTTWSSPVVIAYRRNGNVRLCLDLRLANKAVKRTRYPIPTIEETFEKLTGSTMFSKIDLRSGYHQIELTDSSRDITTFSTASGLYRFKRLVFGLSSASEHYQKIISDLFVNEANIQNISDDILVYGKTEGEHNEALQRCFRILQERNLTINLEKCEFKKESLEYFGFQISKAGIKPTSEKVEAVTNFPEPSNQKELRSFLGLVNYLNRFIPNLAAGSTVLRNLTKKSAEWSWGEEEKQCFSHLKSLVTGTSVMVHFNKHLKSKVVTDASPFGLGGMLLQQQHDGDWKVVTYVSRALTPVESRYSQTEREMLAVVWAIEKLNIYLCGSDFIVETDHKPLIGVFKNSSQLSTRLLRWNLRLQHHSFTVEYIPGPENPVDSLSRFPCKTPGATIKTTNMEDSVNFTLAHAIPKSVTLSEILEASNNDPEIKCVCDAVISGKWSQNKLLKPYKLISNELAVKRGILMKHDRIIIPTELRQRIFDIVHETHGLGIVKTKQHLRAKVWWPGMDQFVEKKIKACILCSATGQTDPHPPYKMTQAPNIWENLNIDICGPLPDGVSLFAIVDQASRWPHIYTINRTDTTTIIEKLSNLFSILGTPVKLISDNGPQFTSREFKNFCAEWGVTHQAITPYHPQSNGEVERLFRTTKKVISICFALGIDWKVPLNKFLLKYRNTPHATTGETPAKLLLKRNMQTKLPESSPTKPLPKEVREKDKINKERIKHHADKRSQGQNVLKPGDRVLLKNLFRRKCSLNYKLEPYVVISGRFNSYTVKSESTGKSFRRHITLLKKIHSANTTLPIVRDATKAKPANIPYTQANIRIRTDQIPNAPITNTRRSTTNNDSHPRSISSRAGHLSLPESAGGRMQSATNQHVNVPTPTTKQYPSSMRWSSRLSNKPRLDYTE